MHFMVLGGNLPTAMMPMFSLGVVLAPKKWRVSDRACPLKNRPHFLKEGYWTMCWAKS